MSMKLHCFGESGHSYKVALTLSLMGLEWEPVFVDFFNGATRNPDYKKLNEMGEAPVLVDGEKILTQSGAILFHLVEKTGQFGGTPEDRPEVLRWILWDNHKLSSQIGMCRFLMNFIPAAKRPEPVIEWLKARSQSAYKVLDAHLLGRDWITGNEPTIADTTCCGYLYYPEPFGFDRARYANIDRWLNNISGLPGWKHPYDLMPGNPSDRA